MVAWLLYLPFHASTARTQSVPQAAVPAGAEVIVSGVVLGTDALPVHGGRVTLSLAGSRRIVATLTDRTGRFRASVAPGVYTVRVVAPGHEPYERRDVEARGVDVRLEVTLTSRPFTLPTIVVIGEALDGVPGSTGVVTAAELESRRPADIRSAIRAVPGIQVADEDAFGLNLNIGIRGLDARRSSRVLLLEDGAPIHLAPYSDPSAHYHPPVETLERIEVLKGSGQILHGPQTVGGVINFVRRIPASPGGSISLAGGGGRYLSGHLLAGGRWREHALSLEMIRRQGDGVREFQSHLVQDVGARAALDLGRGQTLALKAGVYTEDSRFGESGMTQEEFESDPFGNDFRNDVFDLTRYAAQAVHRAPLSGNVLLTSNAYVQTIDRTSWRQANSSSDRFGAGLYAQRFSCVEGAAGLEQCGNQGRPRHYTFWGVEPRLEMDHRLGALLAETRMGGRWHQERVRRRQLSGSTMAARSGTLIRDNTLDTDAVSAFLHHRLTVGAWTVSPGVRVEHVRSLNQNLIDGSRMEDRYTEVLPGFGATLGVLPRTTVFAGIHRGFAPPRPADVLSPETGRGLVQVDAEVSRTAEAGVRSRAIPDVELELTWFRIDFSNQVIEGGLVGGGQRFVNGGRTVHSGGEIAASVSLGSLMPGAHEPFFATGVTYLPVAQFRSERLSSVEPGVSVDGNRLPYAPRSQITATAGYRLHGFTARLDGEHVTGQFADDVSTREVSPDGQRGLIPAHTLLHATASQEVAARGITLFLSATNLTDRIYITDRREGIMVGAPRMVRAGARWAF